MTDIEKRLRNIENALFGKSDTNWHFTGTLSDGVRTGTIGAMTHIIDEDDRPCSKGFHSIEVITPGLFYEGQTGSRKYDFYCNSHDRQ